MLTVLVIIILTYFAKQLNPNAIEVGYIGLPKSLTESGYSPEVISNIVKDNISSINDVAITEIEKMDIKDSWVDNQLEISILNNNIPLQTIRSILQATFNIYPHRITGEATLYSQDSIQVVLRVKQNRCIIKGLPSDFDRLLFQSVKSIYAKIDPYIVAVYHRERREVFESLAIIKAMLEDLPSSDDKWAWNLWGNLLMDEELYSDSKIKFENSILLDSNFYLPYYNMSLACQRDSVADAIRYAKKAIEKNPSYEKSHLQLAFLNVQMRDYEAANASLEIANRLNPHLAEYFYINSLIMFAQRDSLASMQYIRKAINLNNSDSDYHEWVGVLNFRGKDYEKALSSFGKAFHAQKFLTGVKVRNLKNMVTCYDSLKRDKKRITHLYDSLKNKFAIEKFTSLYVARSALTE